jgi:hypothetical protein
VAYYALVLGELLRQLGSTAVVDPIGEIWHHPPGRMAARQATEFRLRPYAAQVEDFLRQHLARIRAAQLDEQRDETAFHLGYKCEQCQYLPHCLGAVDSQRWPASWDLSAVPGMTPIGKQALLARGVRTVGELATARDWNTAELGWTNSPCGWAETRLQFTAPADCEQTELGPGAFHLLLTRDDPELLLNPAAWTGIAVSLAELSVRSGALQVVLDVRRRVWAGGPLPSLLAAHADGWWLDQGYGDLNGDRIVKFLNYLDANH